MADRLTVWSGAFGEIVGGELSSLDDPNAAPIRAVWPTLVVDCLTLNQWPWTIRRAALTGSRIDPVEGPRTHPFIYRYPLPAPNVVGADGAGNGGRIGAGPLAVYDAPDSMVQTSEPYEIEGTDVVTNAAHCSIQYQYHAPEADWPDQFAEYVRLRICARTIGTYGDSTRAPEFRSLADAKFSDVVDSVAQVLPPRRLVSEFATTSGRFGYGLRPLALNDDGLAL